MSKHHFNYGMSDLEQEFELDMGHTTDSIDEDLLERELDQLMDGHHVEAEWGTEPAAYEYDDHDHEMDDVDSGSHEYEFEHTAYFPESTYAERLYELGQREFENEYELQQELDGILDDMHREFLFGRLGGLLKKGVQFVKSNPVLKGLVEKGIGLAANAVAPGIGGLAFQGLKTALGPLSEGLKQRGKSLLAKGVQSLNGRASGIASGFMNRMGISPANSIKDNMSGLQNLVGAVRRSFEFAADNLHNEIDDPMAAERLATQAFEVGVNQSLSATGKKDRFSREKAEHGTRVIRLREQPGEEIEKIVIVIRDKSVR